MGTYTYLIKTNHPIATSKRFERICYIVLDSLAPTDLKALGALLRKNNILPAGTRLRSARYDENGDILAFPNCTGIHCVWMSLVPYGELGFSDGEAREHERLQKEV